MSGNSILTGLVAVVAGVLFVAFRHRMVRGGVDYPGFSEKSNEAWKKLFPWLAIVFGAAVAIVGVMMIAKGVGLL